jgi:hypothetical protein
MEPMHLASVKGELRLPYSQLTYTVSPVLQGWNISNKLMCSLSLCSGEAELQLIYRLIYSATIMERI